MITIAMPRQNRLKWSTDLIAWCSKNIGSAGDHLKHWKMQDDALNPSLGWQWDHQNFYFTNETDATLFKLVWG